MENKHKELLKKLLRHFSDLPCKKSCQHYLKIGNCTGCNAKRDIEEAQKLLQEDRSMEKEQEYEVIAPFTLMDLWDAFEDEHSCKRFQKEWGKLLFEVTFSGRNIKTKFDCYRAIRKYNTLYYNLHHLEKKGFVRRMIDSSKINTDTITAYKIIEEGVVLKPGVRLQSNYDNHKYTVVKSGDSTMRWNKIQLLGDGHKDTNFKPYLLEYGAKYNEGTTLEELNEICDWDFEVIDG